jgi:hypothetical protein
MIDSRKKFGTSPVFFTTISTIFGAILFLLFGFAIGTLGFWGVVLIIILGHMVTIPTALAWFTLFNFISEPRWFVTFLPPFVQIKMVPLNNVGFTIMGFREESLNHEGTRLFEGYEDLGNILFVNSYSKKMIEQYRPTPWENKLSAVFIEHCTIYSNNSFISFKYYSRIYVRHRKAGIHDAGEEI